MQNKDIKVCVWRATLYTIESNDGGGNVMCGDGNYIRLLRVQVDDNAEEWASECEIVKEILGRN